MKAYAYKHIAVTFYFIARAGKSIKGMSIDASMPFYAMQNVRIVNMMRTMKATTPINLEGIHQEHGGKLLKGRPEMLVLPTAVGRNIQMFRNGTIQILGPVSQNKAEAMCHELTTRTHLQVSPMTTSNVVMSAQLMKKPCLSKIQCSNAHVFYEIEVFPAILIRKWEPAHVALFHNGHVIVTGIKSLEEGHCILQNLKRMLE